jgi:hypothetical protein
MELITVNIPGLEDIIDQINNNLQNDFQTFGNLINYQNNNSINDTPIYYGSNVNNSPIGCGGSTSSYNFTPGSQTIEFKFNPW